MSCTIYVQTENTHVIDSIHNARETGQVITSVSTGAALRTLPISPPIILRGDSKGVNQDDFGSVSFFGTILLILRSNSTSSSPSTNMFDFFSVDEIAVGWDFATQATSGCIVGGGVAGGLALALAFFLFFGGAVGGWIAGGLGLALAFVLLVFLLDRAGLVLFFFFLLGRAGGGGIEGG